ncbi:hypothetical protein J1N35_004345 [Gossypium stocksii]|uniref:Uncharacterized protein n=1 Tax=Gossypium stocksii TaxID=47602 RepID=A0A9D3WDW9_9ROSI|nr:hypothetical protein J1N35_004345 [Gossypium stocksii]
METLTRCSMSAFDFNFGTLMIYAGSTYAKTIATKLEGSGSDSDGSDNAGGTQSDFTTYEPQPYMLIVDIDAKNGLGFPELPHKRLSHVSSTNFDNLQVGIEFSSKDVATMKLYKMEPQILRFIWH